MKNTCLLALSCLLSISITQAQNVGIGTNTPTSKLEVSGAGGLKASSSNSGSGTADWIAGNFGAASGERVVIGLLNGQPTIGAHNEALSLWTKLYINPGGGVSIGALAGSGTRMVVADADGTVSSQTIPAGTVTNVSGNLPLSVINGGNTPVISIAKADAVTNGYLSNTDWNTFNNKFSLPPLADGSVLYSNGITITGSTSKMLWDDNAGRLNVFGKNNGTPAAGNVNWIAGNFGGSGGDRVVLGIQNGQATIAAHNASLSGWADLTFNPGGGIKMPSINVTGSSKMMVVAADGTVSSSSVNVLESISAGSVLFSNGTAIDHNPAKLFWDTANKQLGIGTNTPNRTLTVNSANNGTGSIDWVAANFGGTAGDRVLAGIFNGVATIGAHNNSLSAWAKLNINPGGVTSIGSLVGTGTRMVVANATGDLSTQAIPVGDNLGNHTASQNINLNGYCVSGGGNNGIYVNSQGKVSIGTPAPFDLFDVRATSAAVVDQSDMAAGQSTGAPSYNIPSVFQSFTQGIGGYMTRLIVLLNNPGQPPATNTVPTPATLRIFQGAGTGGTMLHSQNISIVGHANGLSINNDFVLTQGVALTAGQAYTFQIIPSTVSYNWLPFNSDNPYAGGGSSLSGNVDLLFETYTAAIVPGFAVTDDGKVGIGTLLPGEKLHVQGNIYALNNIGASGNINCTGNLSCSGTLTVGGQVSFCGGAYTCSDVRYKKDIRPLKNSLQNLFSLNGYSYYWRRDEFPDKQFTNDRQIGLLAQEVEKIYPEMVMTDANTGYKSVDYSKMVPVLLEALKQQQNQIDGLQKRLSAVEKSGNK
jgi:hypothetical protein